MFNGQPLYILKMLGSRNLKKFESSESCLTAACKASSIYESCLTHFEPKPKNKNKIHLEKNSLYFRQWNVLALILKNFKKWKTPQNIPYVSGSGTVKKLLILPEMKLFSPPRKNLLYFRKQKPRKKLIFS